MRPRTNTLAAWGEFATESARPVTGAPGRRHRAPARGRPRNPRPAPANPSRRRSVIGADDLVVAGDEDVMGPVDADAVDFVLAVAQPHHPVDDTAGVRGQRRFDGLVRRGTAE